MAERTAIECPECSGFGRIGDGPFTMGVECSQCDGRGLCDISKATEEVVSKILNKASEQYGREYNEHLVSMLLITIDGPDSTVIYGGDDEDLGYIEPSSLAALKVRGQLWGTYPSDIASNIACDIYYTLSRQAELGWIKENDYRFEG